MGQRVRKIDVSQFASMGVIKMPDQEVVLRGRMLRFVELWKKYDPPLGAAYDVASLEFDPAKIVQEASAEAQTQVESRINQVARALTLAFAVGTDLDGIASRYPGGVPRVSSEIYTSTALLPERALKDNRYRERIWLSPSILAAAGTREMYQYYALTALPEARDVTATVLRTPAEVQAVITVLMEGADPMPTQADLVTVRGALQEEAIMPLTDVVSVRAPGFIDVAYAVRVHLYEWATWSVIQETIAERITSFLENKRWLGLDVAEFEVKALFDVIGVHSLSFEASIPGEVIPADDTQFVRILALNFTKGDIRR